MRLSALLLTAAFLLPPESDHKWADASRSATIEDIKATISATRPVRKDGTLSSDLDVLIRIENLSRTKRREFIGRRDGLVITDQYSNIYKVRSFNPPRPTLVSFGPDNAITLRIATEIPVPDADALRVLIPGKFFRVDGEFLLELPRKEIANIDDPNP